MHKLAKSNKENQAGAFDNHPTNWPLSGKKGKNQSTVSQRRLKCINHTTTHGQKERREEGGVLPTTVERLVNIVSAGIVSALS